MTMLAEPPTARRTRRRNVPTVCPIEADAAVKAGKPLVVDVADFGSGWWIVCVGADTFTVYRDLRELDVPHTAVRLP